jgi:molybdate transport system substrate-binding protein
MQTVKIGAGGEISILSTGAVSRSLTDAATAYHDMTGRSFVLAFDTAGGVEKRAAAGEKPGLFASSMESLRLLATTGALEGAPRPMGSVRIALGVRKGETAPDISTLDAFKAALRNAHTIARGDPGGGGTAAKHLADALVRIGMMDVVAAKSVLRVGGHNVMAVVAEGLADFGITQSTEIVPVEGVEIGGWLPAEAQLTTVYGVALGAHAAGLESARRFFDWLATPEGARFFAAAGFSPP